jgi:hypothetical protein
MIINEKNNNKSFDNSNDNEIPENPAKMIQSYFFLSYSAD